MALPAGSQLNAQIHRLTIGEPSDITNGVGTVKAVKRRLAEEIDAMEPGQKLMITLDTTESLSE